MDYREDIKKCFSSILEQEKVVVNMHIFMGSAVDIRPLVKTLDNLKFIMVYAWEKFDYGTYKDFFHGKELEAKYISLFDYPHELLMSDFKKYLKLSHVRTIFEDDFKSIEKMEEIVNSLDLFI